MKKLLVILLIFIFASCEKDNTDNPAGEDRPIIKNTREKVYSMVVIDGKAQKDVLSLDIESRFDTKGRITESATYEYGEKDPSRIVYTYQNNETFEYIEYGKRGSVYIRGYCKLDKAGNKTEEIMYFPDDGYKIKLEYTYNTKNQIIKIITYTLVSEVDFGKSSFSTYEYDSDGNLIKLIETSYDDNSIYETTYSYQEFDTHKNWTVMIWKSNGINYLSERTIEYYQ